MKHWTEKELSMIETGMTDTEIVKLTGRTILSIQNKRYQMTGHYTPLTKMERVQRDRKEWEKTTKENRIYVLAAKLGVRIKGVGRKCSY